MRLTAKEHTEHNISAILSRLYGIKNFCYSEWVVPRMLIQSKDSLGDYNISTIPRKLRRAEIFSLFLNQDKCYGIIQNQNKKRIS